LFFDELGHCVWRRGAGAAPVVWKAPRGQYLAGEPALAPAPPEPGRGGVVAPVGGVLVCPLFDAVRGESRYLVFDALDVGAGPCAELRLEAPLPTAFHAAFAPAPPSPPPEAGR
jgi:carotenoid cleavage dioxygenase-like enzyme